MSDPSSWDDIRVFLAAAREGSATRAASALRVSVSTVSRRLSALEDAAGNALFARTPDGLSLTPAGTALLRAAESMEAGARDWATTLEVLGSAAAGHVRIAIQADVLEQTILPSMASFVTEHPDITVEFVAGTAVLDLTRREADLAVRGFLPDTGEHLVVKRLRQTSMGVFVREGADPTKWVAWDASTAHLPFARWCEAIAPADRVVARFNSLHLVHKAVAAGLGASILPRAIARTLPRLVEVPHPHLPEPGVLWLMGHAAIRDTPAVDAVWRWLEDLLRDDKDRDELTVLRERLTEAYGLVFDD